MGKATDYSETRACLVRARAAMMRAHAIAGRANLPPTARPMAIRTQIDTVEKALERAFQEIEEARKVSLQEGRRGLALV